MRRYYICYHMRSRIKPTSIDSRPSIIHLQAQTNRFIECPNCSSKPVFRLASSSEMISPFSTRLGLSSSSLEGLRSSASLSISAHISATCCISVCRVFRAAAAVDESVYGALKASFLVEGCLELPENMLTKLKGRPDALSESSAFGEVKSSRLENVRVFVRMKLLLPG